MKRILNPARIIVPERLEELNIMYRVGGLRNQIGLIDRYNYSRRAEEVILSSDYRNQ
jgi:hypothetical protein